MFIPWIAASVRYYKIIYRPIAVGDIITSEQAKTLPSGSMVKFAMHPQNTQTALIINEVDQWHTWLAPMSNAWVARRENNFQPNHHKWLVLYINHS